MLDSVEFASNQWHSQHYFLVRRLLLTLSRVSNCLPPSLFLCDVNCQDKNSVAGGGYADVYKGWIDGHPVAIKRLRVFSDAGKGEATHSVQTFWNNRQKPRLTACHFSRLYVEKLSFGNSFATYTFCRSGA